MDVTTILLPVDNFPVTPVADMAQTVKTVPQHTFVVRHAVKGLSLSLAPARYTEGCNGGGVETISLGNFLVRHVD